MHTGNVHYHKALQQPLLHVLLLVTRARPLPDRRAPGVDVLLSLTRTHAPVQV